MLLLHGVRGAFSFLFEGGGRSFFLPFSVVVLCVYAAFVGNRRRRFSGQSIADPDGIRTGEAAGPCRRENTTDEKREKTKQR